MRYLFGFLCVCALGVMPVVGCSEECQIDEDCNDQNECTDDWCSSLDGRCYHARVPLDDSRKCDFGGLAGVCMNGHCIEDLCAGDPCDDGNECTHDDCDFRDGSCDHRNRTGPVCDFDGLPGICIEGVCEEDLCATGLVCDDGNECTKGFCDRLTRSCVFRASQTCCPCDLNGVPGVCSEGVCVEECSTDEECDDGLWCTGDHCTMHLRGDCACHLCSNPSTCPTDNRPCTANVCDPDLGCIYPNKPDGTNCGCFEWNWCTPFRISYCCTDNRHCQNGLCR